MFAKIKKVGNRPHWRGRYFFGRVMHPPVSGSVQPSQTVFVPPVDVGKRPMARKVAFDETDDVFHPPLAFRILLAAHANLKSALPDVGGKFGRQNQIAVVFAYKQKMILVIDDLASHAAEKFKGVLVAADHIRRGNFILAVTPGLLKMFQHFQFLKSRL